MNNRRIMRDFQWFNADLWDLLKLYIIISEMCRFFSIESNELFI